MIYPANFEQKIGFDRLREQVAALCTMRAARGKLAEETFSASAREIGRRLELADQMRLLLDMEHDFPGGEYPDVDHVVAKLRVEGTFLDVGEVVMMRKTRWLAMWYLSQVQPAMAEISRWQSVSTPSIRSQVFPS